MLRQLDLCSGVGAGFPLAGIKLGGFELLGLCEIDPYCQDILGKRFPGVTIFNDVQELKEGGVYKPGDIDIITASPPCQPFSVQGKRRGATDPRDCIPAVIYAIASIKPRFFAIEEVPGLLTCPFKPGHGSGSYFKTLLGAIFECGYGVEWQSIGSGNFSSPFGRRRLLLVGVSNSLELDWELPTPWAEQVRKSVEGNGSPKIRGVLESEVARSLVQYSPELAQPIGITSGNGVVRRQREAAGNSLDPRVAAIALQRIIYLNSEVTRSTSQSKDKLRHDADKTNSPEPENNGRSPSVRRRLAQDNDRLDVSPTSAEFNSTSPTGLLQHQESNERSPELLEVNPHSLKPHPRNPEIYGEDEDISDLVEQIRRTAWIKPLVVNKQHHIISGHRRWKAALALGLETVPVEVREFDSELDELEALLLENQYRDKTIEQRVREARTWEEIEREKARVRQIELAGTRPNTRKDLRANLPTGTPDDLRANLPTGTSDDLRANLPTGTPDDLRANLPTGTPDDLRANLPTASSDVPNEIPSKGRTLEKVAQKVGMKRRNYEKAAKVVEFIDEIADENPEQAESLRKTLNHKSVNAAFKKISGTKKDISEQLREKPHAPFPYQVGEVCRVIPKDEPQLKGRGGCWAIVTKTNEFSCDIELWNGKAELIRSEYLVSLEYTPEQCQQRQKLSDRIARLREYNLEPDAYSILSNFGRQKQPELTPFQEKLLSFLEQEYVEE